MRKVFCCSKPFVHLVGFRQHAPISFVTIIIVCTTTSETRACRVRRRRRPWPQQRRHHVQEGCHDNGQTDWSFEICSHSSGTRVASIGVGSRTAVHAISVDCHHVVCKMLWCACWCLYQVGVVWGWLAYLYTSRVTQKMMWLLCLLSGCFHQGFTSFEIPFPDNWERCFKRRVSMQQKSETARVREEVFCASRWCRWKKEGVAPPRSHLTKQPPESMHDGIGVYFWLVTHAIPILNCMWARKII